MTAQIDFYRCCCWRALLLFFAIDRQQQSSNSAAVVRCLQQRRGQPSASTCLRGPVARCCCRVGRYAPARSYLLVLLQSAGFFFFFFLGVKALIPPGLKSCHVHTTYFVRTIIVRRSTGGCLSYCCCCTLLLPGFSYREHSNSSIIAV